ncbi:MAG: ABC-2 transporter permease [Solobacterium sp.]|nr:ABC-2 transporter permease [Solobacterium sp.]
MKGLMVKDLLLMKDQWKSTLIVLMMGFFMSFSFDSSVTIMYMTMIGCMLALGTLAYDEFDNGYQFLFTLPVSRRTYVIEKFAVVICWGICAMAAGFLMSALTGFLKNGVLQSFSLENCVGVLFSASILASIMIPIRIKYGSENSKIVIYVMFGIIAAAVLAFSKLKAAMNFANTVGQWLSGVSDTVIALTLIAVIILGITVSMFISFRIIEKKEY